ncbi:MAG: hypothetical protein RLZ92_1697 [Pseudomonadota bacterium]
MLRNAKLKEWFVDIWSVDLLFDCTALQFFLSTLSAEELAKLEGFKLQQQSNRYLAVRGVLRQILAGYLEVQPADLIFVRNVYGKPFLANASLFFNISHSGDCLLIAVSDFDSIGVDIELIKSGRNLLGLAKRCFSADELNFWFSLPEDARERWFYQLWVRKEAFVKAVGRGIALGLDLCELQLPSLDRLSKIPDDFGLADNWKVAGLQVADDSVAALVMPNRSLVLNQYGFEL